MDWKRAAAAAGVKLAPALMFLGLYGGAYYWRHQSLVLVRVESTATGFDTEFPTLAEDVAFWPAKRLHELIHRDSLVRAAKRNFSSTGKFRQRWVAEE